MFDKTIRAALKDVDDTGLAVVAVFASKLELTAVEKPVGLKQFWRTLKTETQAEILRREPKSEADAVKNAFALLEADKSGAAGIAERAAEGISQATR